MNFSPKITKPDTPTPHQGATIRGFVLHVFHRTSAGYTNVHVIGKLESGETFEITDNSMRPHFFVRSTDAERCRDKALAHNGSISDAGLTTMDQAAVSRIDLPRTSEQRQLAESLAATGVRTYEADFNFSLRYLMQHNISGSLAIQGNWEPSVTVNRRYVNPTITPAEWEPVLQLLSLDIETNADASTVYGVSLVTADTTPVEEMHLVGEPTADDPAFATCYPTEREMLTGVIARIRSLDPDILTGWNLIDFDLPTLLRRCKALGLEFAIGRSHLEVWYREGSSWGGSRVFVPGRQVLDGMHLMRATMQKFEDYSLETVAEAVLGRGKVLGSNGGSRVEAITDSFHNDRRTFCEYCVEDSRLVRDILNDQGLITLSIRRTLLTGLPLERAWGSVAPFEFLYIRELHRLGMVAPTLGIDQEPPGGAPGGLVMTPEPGLYRHVFVMDFKSLYPTIIRTFNLDPLAHVQGRTATDPIIAPNGAKFDRHPGVLPMLLERFFESRAEARAEGNAIAAHAYKIIMNSFYGVLGTSACRFAATELAGAITGFGHHLLRWTRRWLEDQGYNVLYGDTDSLFVEPRFAGNADTAASLAFGQELSATVNERLARYVESTYGVESHLDFEFEKYYRNFFLPRRRGESAQGRAKGYAGIRVDNDGEELEIVGMEAVRSDWTDIAHAVQRQLLEMVFDNASADELDKYLMALVASVKSGKRDEDLVYRKRLRKPIDQYTRTTPPHVKAARLLPDPHGMIRYLVTTDGPQPLGYVTAPLDYKHYIEKQIGPVATAIGELAGVDFLPTLTGEQWLFEM